MFVCNDNLFYHFYLERCTLVCLWLMPTNMTLFTDVHRTTFTAKNCALSFTMILFVRFASLNFCWLKLFRWFKFTLKPPNSITHGNLLLAIWDTSHWNIFVKFGLKTAWHISYDILWSLLTYVNFWRLQGHLSTFAKIWGPQKIKVFLMKEWSVVDKAWGF